MAGRRRIARFHAISSQFLLRRGGPCSLRPRKALSATPVCRCHTSQAPVSHSPQRPGRASIAALRSAGWRSTYLLAVAYLMGRESLRTEPAVTTAVPARRTPPPMAPPATDAMAPASVQQPSLATCGPRTGRRITRSSVRPHPPPSQLQNRLPLRRRRGTRRRQLGSLLTSVAWT